MQLCTGREFGTEDEISPEAVAVRLLALALAQKPLLSSPRMPCSTPETTHDRPRTARRLFPNPPNPPQPPESPQPLSRLSPGPAENMQQPTTHSSKLVLLSYY